jgi:hypothetical protein
MANFMGKNGFQWFVGVVEDRQDPKHLGRIRVRALGYHTENLTDLPTADLPWAHPMNPITSATVSGVGQTPLGSVEGTWVVGFFQDGADAQQPIIIGTLPGVPSSLPDTGSNKGFQDHTNANYPKYKETDVNRLAVNEKSGLLELNPHSTLTIRRADRDIFVGQADWTQTELRINQGLTVTLPVDDGKSFSEPATPYGAVYPYNHVVETESGHIRELDDTPGAERIHERHASGTSYEIAADGTKVTRVKKDNYDIVTGDHYAHIKGNHSTTVDGGVRVFVNADASTDDNNYTIEVGNNANVNIQVNKGDVNVHTVEGNINMKSGKDIRLDAAGDIRMTAQSFGADIAGTWTEKVDGFNSKTGDGMTIKAVPINLNP